MTPQSEDFSAWYNELVFKAELVDRGPVKGTMVIRPYGYRLWELLQADLDRRIKETGHQNAYFPLLIPQSYLQREAEHVEGFAPELAVVTHAGGKELEEPLVVRPTSETIIGEIMSKWISSHRDLPMLLNQWANVVRWEMRPRMFLRTTEFLWQEGHTAHADEADAMRETMLALGLYTATARELAAMPVVEGEKTAGERFAGAVRTFTIEAMMRDGRALQAGTSHYLGTNFARAFDIQYTGEDGHLALCAHHVLRHEHPHDRRRDHDARRRQGPGAAAPARALPGGHRPDRARRAGRRGHRGRGGAGAAAGRRGHPGARGRPAAAVPGLQVQRLGAARRADPAGARPARPGRGQRGDGPAARRTARSPSRWTARPRGWPTNWRRSRTSCSSGPPRSGTQHTVTTDSWDDFTAAVATGWARALHCGTPECEEEIKAETAATARCIPLDGEPESGPCIRCGLPSAYGKRVIFGRSY